MRCPQVSGDQRLDRLADQPRQLGGREAAAAALDFLELFDRERRFFGRLRRQDREVSRFSRERAFFEVGFNHFFRGADGERGGDVVFFQPHSAPGVYARAFLEGRLTEAQLADPADELLSERFQNLLLDDQAGGGRAALAGCAEGAPDGSIER